MNELWGKLEKIMPPKFYLTASPLILVLVFISLYIFFDWYLVRCGKEDGANCSKIDSQMVSRVESAANYLESKKRLEIAETTAGNLSQNLANKTAELVNTNTNLQQITLDSDKSKTEETNANIAANTTLQANANANAKRLDAQKTLVNDEIALKQSEINSINQNVETHRKNALNIRKQYSGRYSNRLIWVFLTAIFVALGCAAIFCAIYVSYKSFLIYYAENKDEASQQTLWWGLITFVVAAIFALFVLWNKAGLGSLTHPMLTQSVITYEGISENMLAAFVTFGFFSSIFLISASSVIFSAAVKNKESEIVDTEKLEKYALLLKYLRTILYFATFMLFVGILRMTYLINWHLAFISSEPTNDMYKLILTLTNSSTSVLGGFYTILLAAIYLPATSWIKVQIEKMKKDENELKAAGVVFSNYEIIFRILAIASPLITSAFGNSVNWLGFFKGN